MSKVYDGSGIPLSNNFVDSIPNDFPPRKKECREFLMSRLLLAKIVSRLIDASSLDYPIENGKNLGFSRIARRWIGSGVASKNSVQLTRGQQRIRT